MRSPFPRRAKPLCRALGSVELRKPVNVVVLDAEMLEENAKPGEAVSGLIVGCRIIHDKAGIPGIVEGMVRAMSKEEEYMVIEESKKPGPHALAKIKEQLRERVVSKVASLNVLPASLIPRQSLRECTPRKFAL